MMLLNGSVAWRVDIALFSAFTCKPHLASLIHTKDQKTHFYFEMLGCAGRTWSCRFWTSILRNEDVHESFFIPSDVKKAERYSIFDVVEANHRQTNKRVTTKTPQWTHPPVSGLVKKNLLR